MRAFINLSLSLALALVAWYSYPKKKPIETSPIEIKPAPVSLSTAAIKNPVLEKLSQTYDKKNFKKALELLNSELEKTNDPKLKAWLLRQQPIILTSLGWQYYEKSQFFDAITSFETALKTELALAYKGLAASYFKLRYLWQAESYAKRYLDFNRNDKDSYLILMETLELAGNLEETYAYALKLAGLESLSSEDKKLAQKNLTR